MCSLPHPATCLHCRNTAWLTPSGCLPCPRRGGLCQPPPQRLFSWDSEALTIDNPTHPQQCPDHQAVLHYPATSESYLAQLVSFQKLPQLMLTSKFTHQCPPGPTSSTPTASRISSFPLASSPVTAENSLCPAFRWVHPHPQSSVKAN